MGFLVQHLLTETAGKLPDKTAVVSSDESITYQHLDEITDKLAMTLREEGVKRGDRVGIYMKKSLSSIISALGILKAGSVYVPLDPNAPIKRLAYIINDSGIKCLVTSSAKAGSLTEMFPETSTLNLVILADNSSPKPGKFFTKLISWENVTNREKASPPVNTSIETDLAYILYTSGSTGVPKGVMISHLNALTFVNWAHKVIKVNPDDRVSNHAPIHFDLSIFDIFTSFMAGATLVIVPEALSNFPVRLAQWIDEQQISVWYSVPSVLSMMVRDGNLGPGKWSKLRSVMFAGEVFPIKYLRKLMILIPHAEYHNLYGPTETNVITHYQVPRVPAEQADAIPIGKACANTEVFALNPEGERITRPGQIGELFARGSCVAQGYWGDLEKTDRSFVLNGTQANFRERMFKSGDLVTLDEEDNYIFLGRQDHMVKSRGFRIELAEIETALYHHPEIKEAAVVAIPDEMVGNRLKAFVVMDSNSQCGSIELKNFCSKRIPKYMIPETIDFLETLPKTSTGKIDRPQLMTQT